jgi:thioredoxin
MFRIVCLVLLATFCNLRAVEAGDAVREITSAKQFDELIASTKGTVVVDFHAEWCGPCKELGPILEEVVKENAGKVVLLKVDVDKNEELAKRFSIEAIPAVYTFQDGKQTGAKIGLMDKDAVKKLLGL